MGLLQDGQWVDKWYDTKYSSGRYIRKASQFRNWVTVDGAAGTSGKGHFKCNLRRIADYPNLSNYVCDLYQVPGIAETVDISYIKKHYYGSHETVNPTRVVPMGPDADYNAPHNRANFSQE